MESNSMLEEVWRVKDECAREPGGDSHRLCQNIHQRPAGHTHPSPTLHNTEGLRHLTAEMVGLKLGKPVIVEPQPTKPL